MALNRDFVGREFPASEAYEVGREHIRQFATAIGDRNPLYVDPEVARAAGHRDVIAPPTFLTVLGFRFAGEGPIADPDLGLDYSRLVHGGQTFRSHRPVVAGDRLRLTTRVDAIRGAGGNELMTTVQEVTDESGEPVATLTSTVVIRGGEARP